MHFDFHYQFLDVILSKTQRKTPTVIRSGFKISRIRAFCECLFASVAQTSVLNRIRLQTCARSNSRKRRSKRGSIRS